MKTLTIVLNKEIARLAYNAAYKENNIGEYRHHTVNELFEDWWSELNHEKTQRTPVLSWMLNKSMSKRLRNILTNVGEVYRNVDGKELILEDIDMVRFRSWTNAGQKSWYEFKDLRGY